MAKKTTTKKTADKSKTTDKKQAGKKTAKNQQPSANNDQAKEIEKLIAENDSIELKFSWKEINPLYVKELKKIAQNLKVKGFRKGHAPPEIAAKEIDPKKVIDAVLKQVIPDAYDEAIKKGGYTPLTEPEFQAISLNKDNDWVIKAIFAQKPEIKLGNWKKTAGKAKKKAQQSIKEHNKKAEAQKSKTNKTKQTKKSKQDNAQDQTQAQKPLSPQEEKDAIIQAILGKLAEEIKPAIPSLLIRQNTQRELDSFARQLEQLNVKIEDFLKARNMTQDQLTMEMFLQSLNKLQVEFIINAIAEEQKIKAEDKDVETRIKAIEDEDTRKKVEQDMQYKSYLKAVIAKQKVLDYLADEV